MFESFVIMLREGIEAALVIGIIMVVIKRMKRRDLERPVYRGLGMAILASIGAAIALNLLPINEEAYEGVLYWVSAAFVASMMWWMHRKSKTLRAEIERRVESVAESASRGRSSKEAWGLGTFAFLMVFREGAEAVMFLSAVNLTTDAMLSFIGTVLGLAAAVVFCVMFIRGSLQVNLRRFFIVTEWVLGIFVIQLLINGYHEFSEAGVVPATQKSMALVGPVVRNNSLFIIALVAIPLFVWLSRKSQERKTMDTASVGEKRLLVAKTKRERQYRYGAVISALVALLFVGIVYARELMPKQVPSPESVMTERDSVVVPLEKLEDGKLHRLGLLSEGQLVRFLAMKTPDGKYRTGFDACKICGAFGYIQEGENLVCLNCVAEIPPSTLGNPGGCNPIPLENEVKNGKLLIPIKALMSEAPRFSAQPGLEEIDPVCGMRIKMNEASGFETFEGKTYYFCSGMKCQAMFKADPSKFVTSKKR